MVIHALTGSADAAGDWWEPIIGPGRALDTDRHGVLCANLLGGRYGSTGPTSLDPSTGQPYGRGFPSVTARDNARALWALADRLDIHRFALVAGGSLGGMIALEVALERPESVGHVVPLGAPAATGAMAIAWNHIQLELIDALGDRGLALARQMAMTTYRSEEDFDGRFGRGIEPDGRFRSSPTSTTRATRSWAASTPRPTARWSGSWTPTTWGVDVAGCSPRSGRSPPPARP